LTRQFQFACALSLACLVCLGQSPWGDLRSLFRRAVDTHYAIPAYRSLDEWKLRRIVLRKQVLTAAGLRPMLPKTPLHPRRFGRIDKGSFYIEKTLIETMPGYSLAGNLYLPKTSKPAPAVLIPHGHWKHGRVHDADDYSVPALAANLAHQGYVAFTYDMVGYNDTRQTSHNFGGSEEEQLWGFSPLGLQLWNSIRSVDFVSALPEVDPRRIGVTGASGGATQTLLLTAVEDRIQVSIPVCMVSATFQGDCACEQAPGLRMNTSNLELAGLAAPRPMLLLSSTKDWTKRTPAEEFPAIQSIYRIYGQESKVQSIQIDYRHNYNRTSREAAYRFLHRTLKPDSPLDSARENLTVDFRDEELLIGRSTPPSEFLDQAGVFARWRELSRQSLASLSDVEREEMLASTLGVSWPRRVEALPAGPWLLLERFGSGDRVPSQWQPGQSGQAAMFVHPGGVQEARRTQQAVRIANTGSALLFVDVFQTGTTKTDKRSVCGRDCLTYQRGDEANRVSDILTGLSYLAATHPGRITLHCSGKAGLWCVLAAALTPAYLKVDVDLTDSEGLERPDFRARQVIPGLQRAGGVGEAMRLARSKHALHIESGD
jgi:dienelactone hydrolase